MSTVTAPLDERSDALRQRGAPGPNSAIMRVLHGLTVLAVGGAFTLLFIFGERTHDIFAWTIDPPAAAALLGAGYGSIVVSSVLSVLARSWAELRIPVAVLLIGLLGILGATLLHLDRFHFARAEFVARNVAIGWIVLYASIPPLFAIGLAVQLRAGTGVVPSSYPLPAWARLGYWLIALATGAAGAGLFLAPAVAGALWFWPLTPLLARMTAAWLLGVSSAAALSALDNNLARLRIVAVTLVVYAVLQLVVLVRYAGSVDWSAPAAWAWLALLALLLAVDLWALWAGRALQPAR